MVKHLHFHANLIYNKDLVGVRFYSPQHGFLDIAWDTISGVKKNDMKPFRVYRLYEEDGLLATEDELRRGKFAKDMSEDKSFCEAASLLLQVYIHIYNNKEIKDVDLVIRGLQLGVAPDMEIDKRTLISYLIRTGDVSAVEFALSKGADLKESSRETPTLVHAAETPEMLLFLTRKLGVDVLPNYHGFGLIKYSTPLAHNIARGRLDLAEILLQLGADPLKAENRDSQSALEVACETGNLDAVKLILKYHPNIDLARSFPYTLRDPLACAIRSQNLELVRFLVDRTKHTLNVGDSYGRTKLHYLVELFEVFSKEKLDIIKILVENGADIHKEDHYGTTPYTLANGTKAMPNSDKKVRSEVLDYFNSIQNGVNSDLSLKISLTNFRESDYGETSYLYADIYVETSPIVIGTFAKYYKKPRGLSDGRVLYNRELITSTRSEKDLLLRALLELKKKYEGLKVSVDFDKEFWATGSYVDYQFRVTKDGVKLNHIKYGRKLHPEEYDLFNPIGEEHAVTLGKLYALNFE